jgi:hypothetical protein
MHLVGYLYEDYHDARSLEHKGRKLTEATRFLPYSLPFFQGSVTLVLIILTAFSYGKMNLREID